MLVCPKCGNSEQFVQRKAKQQLILRLTFSQGTLHCKAGDWKPAIGREEGVFCVKDNTKLKAVARVLEGFHLNDEPPKPREAIDLAKTVKEIKRSVPKADLILPSAPIQRFEAREGTYRPLPENIRQQIPPDLQRAIQDGLGVSLDSLYSHQVEAIAATLAGENVVIRAGTAGGKSLCYLVPVLSALLQDRKATAFFVFPTKALSFDQLKKVADLDAEFDNTILQTLFSLKNLDKNEIWVNWGHESTPDYPRTCR